MTGRTTLTLSLLATAATAGLLTAGAAEPAAGRTSPGGSFGGITGGSFTPPPPDKIPVCTRASLQAAVDSYLAAQTAGDGSKMTFAGNAKVLENMADVAPDKGMWNRKLPTPIAKTRSVSASSAG